MSMCFYSIVYAVLICAVICTVILHKYKKSLMYIILLVKRKEKSSKQTGGILFG